jgi:ribosome-associated protein
MRVITVNTVPVDLYKILKFEGLVGSGAEAKAVVAEGQVKVNGDVETRKRKKILDGDLIEFGTETLRIVLDETPQEN